MDLWSPDADATIAAAEARLTDALLGRLYQVHTGAHVALGLPAIPEDAVQEAYRTFALPVAKAGGYSRAAQLFAELRANPPRARKVDDLADALTQQWFEAGLLRGEAERAVVTANARGRIEAARAAPARPVEQDAGPDGALDWAIERAGQHVTRLRDTTRATLAGAVVDALLRGDSPQTLAVTLTQRFGTLNRDARRLAITEIAFARNNGFLSAVPAGERVAWFTAAGCCPACGRMDGREFEVTRGPADPQECVWPGKHNVGLPADERTPSLPYHPNCRCRWRRVDRAPQGVSERTLAALAAMND